ncbi:MAG: hypothetical protein KDD47_21615 [Acidobacteria bacterium]|nr:hypothetical protein [Acidobacteriota bacterium]
MRTASSATKARRKGSRSLGNGLLPGIALFAVLLSIYGVAYRTWSADRARELANRRDLLLSQVKEVEAVKERQMQFEEEEVRLSAELERLEEFLPRHFDWADLANDFEADAASLGLEVVRTAVGSVRKREFFWTWGTHFTVKGKVESVMALPIRTESHLPIRQVTEFHVLKTASEPVEAQMEVTAYAAAGDPRDLQESEEP